MLPCVDKDGDVALRLGREEGRYPLFAGIAHPPLLSLLLKDDVSVQP